MGIVEVFDEDDFLPHQKIVKTNWIINDKKPDLTVLYDGIPITYTFFDGEKWHTHEEYKNKTWNKELQIWE